MAGKIYTATITIVLDEDAEPVTTEELKNYLENAVVLDLDTEENGSMGVESVAVDWETMKEITD